ncbi:MAG: hypothetical protein V4659_08125 [Pseudomonadota bacterium]
MASHATPLPDRFAVPVAALVQHGLWIAIGAALVIRLAALIVVPQALASDGLAYFTLARSLAETGVMTDNWGHHAFYSPGYPLLLAPFFWVFGAGSPVAHFVNLGLAAVSTALVWRLVQAIGGSRGAAVLGALGFAVWLPSIWEATDLARENLSTPLMLGFALILMGIARGAADWRRCAAAGLLYGCGLLAGTSVVLTAAAFLVALAIALHRTPRAGLRRLLAFAAAALLVLTPWLIASNAMIGRPVITSNGPFNLYLGNNPAADGHFVSMRHTPLAKVWHARIAVLGEAGTSDWLAEETRRWIAANPGRAATLVGKKLALFWAPNVPDRADVAASPLLAGLRIIDLLQWAIIVTLGGVALLGREFDRRLRWPLLTLVATYWVIHGATYIIPRYRDPIMPVLIALAATAAARLAGRWRSFP